MKILVYRPLVCQANSAFEAQALIYGRLQSEYGYQFRLVIADSDSFRSHENEIVRFRPSRFSLNMSRLVTQIPTMLKNQLIAFRPDLILGLDPSAYAQGLQAMAAARKFGIPYLFDVSKTICETKGLFSRRLLAWQLRSLNGIKAGVIATGPKCLERLSLLRGFPETLINNALILGHPFDEGKVQIKENYPCDGGTITVVSRLVMEKGIHYILEAVGPILKEYPVWKLQFVGKGPLEDTIKGFAREEKLESQILCRGEVSHKDVPELLARSDIYINHAVSTPAWEEYFGIANIEAMAAGLPCVVSDSGSITWAIRENGIAWIVAQRNTAALSEAVNELVRSADLRKKMGLKAKDYAWRKYSLNLISDRYASSVKKLTS